MSGKLIISNATVVNEGEIYQASIFIEDGFINKIHRKDGKGFSSVPFASFAEIIDATGLYVIPGLIDDQVHFREPGLTHKADIFSESKAAVSGGITSFMDMPNTIPNVLTQKLLEEKYDLASQKSIANYSFYMGASNDNIEEIQKINPKNVCGVKVFMGASTGNMLVDSDRALENIFSIKNILVATHCEDESIIKANTEKYKLKYGEDAPIESHPKIRSRQACYASTAKAVALAKKHGTRLHVLHLSTADELSLFSNSLPVEEKSITAEVCVHHLLFNKSDYKGYGRLIKWNPAIKDKKDQEALLEALKSNVIDVVATDHAPHTYEEKQQPYFRSASGGPMVQHALVAMLEFYHNRKISLETIVEKMCHAPAKCFRVKKRGYLREGYHADIAIMDLNDPWTVNYDNINYKCAWSPLLGQKFNSRVTHTIVNGSLAYERGEFKRTKPGQRLLFNSL